jgi:hypothetical protein
VLDSIATYWQNLEPLDISKLDDSSSSNTQQQHKQKQQQQQQLHSTCELLDAAVKAPLTMTVVVEQSVQQDRFMRNLSAKYLMQAVTDQLQQQQHQCSTAVTVAAALAALKSYRLYCVALPTDTERTASLAVVDYCTAKLLQCKATLSSSSDDTVLERWTQSVQQSAEVAAVKLREISQANMLLQYIL